MKISFDATFATDGDYYFDKENLEAFFTPTKSLYRKVKINYFYDGDSYERIYIKLYIEGDENSCRWAMRDLLQGLICSIRTIKYWLVKDLYDLLEYFLRDLWGELNQDRSKGLSGNYENTWLSLTMEE